MQIVSSYRQSLAPTAAAVACSIVVPDLYNFFIFTQMLVGDYHVEHIGLIRPMTHLLRSAVGGSEYLNLMVQPVVAVMPTTQTVNTAVVHVSERIVNLVKEIETTTPTPVSVVIVLSKTFPE